MQKYEVSLKLCYICPEYPPVVTLFGGIGVAVQAEAEWFAAHNHNVTVVCPAEVQKERQFVHNGVRIDVIASGKIKGSRIFTDRLRVSQHVKQILRGTDGIVLCADYCGILFQKTFPNHLIVHLHGAGSFNAAQQNRKPRLATLFFERRTLQLANHLRALSHFVGVRTQEILRLPPRSFRVIPNCVDTNAFMPSPSEVDASSMLFVGKLNRVKGLLPLSDALKLVFATTEKSHITIVGQDMSEGGRSMKLQFLERLPACFHHRVNFIERLSRQEVASFTRQAGICILPSYTEVFPLVILEAMASGRPVIASERGGIPEILKNGETGLLADPDKPETFANALLELLRRPDIGNTMGKAGRDKVINKYTQNTVFKELSKFYEQII